MWKDEEKERERSSIYPVNVCINIYLYVFKKREEVVEEEGRDTAKIYDDGEKKKKKNKEIYLKIYF